MLAQRFDPQDTQEHGRKTPVELLLMDLEALRAEVEKGPLPPHWTVRLDRMLETAREAVAAEQTPPADVDA